MFGLFNPSGGHFNPSVLYAQISRAVLLIMLTDAAALLLEGLGGWLHDQDREFPFLPLSDFGFRMGVFDGQNIQATANPSFAVSAAAPDVTIGAMCT